MTRIGCSRADLERAEGALRAGGVVAIPTDTLYGLAADPFSEAALERLATIKGRDGRKPLLLLLDETSRAASLASRLPQYFEAATRALWPGPVTLLLPAAPSLPTALVGAGGTVALRVPAHAVARELCAIHGGPLTGTSANPSGMAPPVTADEVAALFPAGAPAPSLLVDGGRCTGGPPSTLLDLCTDPPRIVRMGAVSREAIQRALGVRVL